jgi:O-antigen biosynthesis protein
MCNNRDPRLLEMTLIAPPQQLYEILISILIGRGWRYLRYRHFRAALRMAQGTRSVLTVGAGKGLAEVALALEHPDITFTVTEHPKAMRGFKRARNLARRLQVTNVRFAALDLTSRRLPSQSFDLVAAIDTLQHIEDFVPAAAKLAAMSQRWVYCDVPFADEARRKDQAARDHALREFNHHVVGFDPKLLLRLFPEPVAMRGSLWHDAGVRLRQKLQDSSDESIRDLADALLAQAELDLRPGWPADRSEAQGIWILSRVTPPASSARPGALRRWLGLGRVNPNARPWELLDERRIIEISGMFDAGFYARTYPEFAGFGQDLLGHYLQTGAEQGAWPNALFDTAFYVRQSRVDPSRSNPLAHYILEGRARRLPTCERDGRRGGERGEQPIVRLAPAPAPAIPPSTQAQSAVAAGTAKSHAAGALTPLKPREQARHAPELRAALEASGLFDVDFYLKQYADIAQKQVEPLGHYIRAGAREGRNPNYLFDTLYYAKRAGIDAAVVNPLLHYIIEGESRGLPPSERFDVVAYRAANPDAGSNGTLVLTHAVARLREQSKARQASRSTAAARASVPSLDLRQLKVTIIIPVYNGGEHVRRCLDSVLTETRLALVKLLVLDDASPDDSTVSVLRDYAELPNVELRRNSENLGFTRNVNLGFTLADPTHDVVLLNSDTIVGPRWLEHLALAAYASHRIATATALSDNAGAFSTPEVEYNPTHLKWDVATAARLSRRAAAEDTQDFPTGSGFCMYMRREALQAVGAFDAERFPRGYGEENDWCLRASEQGFRHVIALRSYVAHVNAVSFGAAKGDLRRAARQVLDTVHPDYSLQLREAQADAQALKSQRAAFAISLQQRTSALPRILYVTSTRTGGVPQTNQDLMRGVSRIFSPLLLECNSHEITLSDVSQGEPLELESHKLRERVGILNHASSEYDDVVRDWLIKYDVELLHIRHVAWHGLGLTRVARGLGIPVVFSFHDFYALCPSVNLVGGHERFQETGVIDPQIVAPLWKSVDAEGYQQAIAMNARAFIDTWRRRMTLMLEQCSALVTTSRSAKALIEAQLPATRRVDESFVVIPHGRDFEHFFDPPPKPIPDERLRVLVAGNIEEAKGLNTFLSLLTLDQQQLIELHVVGGTKPQLSEDPRVKAYGRYRRGALPELIQQIRPHLSAILSVCPETFSHTLTESWAAGLPVLGTELGAVGERIAETGAGWLVDPLDADAVLSALYRIRSGASDWEEKVAQVRAWQAGVGRERTVRAMAQDYLDLYRRVLTSKRPLLPSSRRRGAARTRVALVGKDHYPDAPPTVHVRLATPVRASSGEVAYDWVDAGELVRTGVVDFDGVVVCRNASDGKVLRDLAHVCAQAQLPMIVDLDDDLLGVPPDKDVDGRYAADLAGLESLLRAAPLTTVTTNELANSYASRCRKVRVSPNALDAKLWFEPIARATEPPPGWAKDARIKALYVGSPTHGQDLALVLPVFKQLAKTHDVALHIVGVDNTSHTGCFRIRPPVRQYDLFVPWLRSIIGYFDIAIAPLVDTPFNRRKSALKFMEYAACGIPVVASRVPPYSTTVREGVDALLADDAESWTEQLARLAQDADLRQRLASAALARARDEFIATSCVFDSFAWRTEGFGPVGIPAE